MWWFLLKGILSTVIGSQFYKWYADTKVGIWAQRHIDDFGEYISKKYNITLIKKQSKFERDYPLMMERIEKLEQNAISDGDSYNNDEYIKTILEKNKNNGKI